MIGFDLNEYAGYDNVNIFNFYGPIHGDIIGFTNADEEEVENIANVIEAEPINEPEPAEEPIVDPAPVVEPERTYEPEPEYRPRHRPQRKGDTHEQRIETVADPVDEPEPTVEPASEPEPSDEPAIETV